MYFEEKYLTPENYTEEYSLNYSDGRLDGAFGGASQESST